eukprot:1678128-Rhodomonas_salina.1
MPLRAGPLPQNRGQRRGTPGLVLTMPPVSLNVDKSHSRTHRQPRRLHCMGQTCNPLARSERRTNLLGTQPTAIYSGTISSRYKCRNRQKAPYRI